MEWFRAPVGKVGEQTLLVSTGVEPYENWLDGIY